MELWSERDPGVIPECMSDSGLFWSYERGAEAYEYLVECMK